MPPIESDLRAAVHPACVVCSPTHPHGLKLHFSLNEQGEAEAEFACPAGLEGYPGLLHGGVITMLLDGAMTNCLFLHGREAVTAELLVRFRHPVGLESPILLRARMIEDQPPVFRLQAHLFQDGKLKATARGAFMLPKTEPFGPAATR